MAVVLATNVSLLPARASEIIRVVGYCYPILMVPKPKLALVRRYGRFVRRQRRREAIVTIDAAI
jgi:hypothetical protein